MEPRDSTERRITRRRGGLSTPEPPWNLGEKILFVVVVLLAIAIVVALGYGTMVSAHA